MFPLSEKKQAQNEFYNNVNEAKSTLVDLEQRVQNCRQSILFYGIGLAVTGLFFIGTCIGVGIGSLSTFKVMAHFIIIVAATVFCWEKLDNEMNKIKSLKSNISNLNVISNASFQFNSPQSIILDIIK